MSQFHYCTPVNRCPLCGGGSDCRINAEGGVHCRRTPSAPPPLGWHFAKIDAKGFNVFYADDPDDAPPAVLAARHANPFPYAPGAPLPPKPGRPHLNDSTPGNGSAPPSGTTRRTPDNFTRIRDARYPMLDAQRLALAMRLGLPTDVLGALGTQFVENAYGLPGWVFEEKDGHGQVIGFGIRRNVKHRPNAEEKRSAGKRGLYIPSGWKTINPAAPLFLVEGASDTLTMTALRLPSIGRPSNTDGVEHLVTFLSQPALAADPERMIVVVGENDKKPNGQWPGRDGAVRTAERLAAALGRTVWVAFPPAHAKDVRAWWHDCKRFYDPATSPATPAEYGLNLSDYLVKTAIAIHPGVHVAEAGPAAAPQCNALGATIDPLTGQPINYARDLVVPQWITAPEQPPGFSDPDVRAALPGCPRPRGVVQHNFETGHTRLLFIDCRCLDCEKCGVVRRRHYADTVTYHLGRLPDGATIYRLTCGRWEWERLSAKIRRRGGNYFRLTVNAGPVEGYVVYTDRRPPRVNVTDEYTPADATGHICTHCLSDLQLKPKAFVTSRAWKLLADNKVQRDTGFTRIGKFAWTAATVQEVLDYHGVRNVTTYSNEGRYFGWTAWQWSHSNWERIVEDIYVGEGTPIEAELSDEDRQQRLIEHIWGGAPPTGSLALTTTSAGL